MVSPPPHRFAAPNSKAPNMTVLDGLSVLENEGRYAHRLVGQGHAVVDRSSLPRRVELA